MECSKCHKFVEDTWKMCPHCRTMLTPIEKSEEEKRDPLQVYKNKAVWRIMPGEVARHIHESELDNFNQITGIIIEEGVSAYVYVNGMRVAELSSGAYEFTSQEEIDKVLNDRVGGLKNGSINAWRWIVGLVKGKRVGDQIESKEDENDFKSMEDVLRYVRQDSVVSIYLKLDKSFPLLFGTDESGINYNPILVRTQLDEIKVGLTMQLQVSDFNAFIPHYLVGKKRVTRQDIQQELSNEIEAVLRHNLASEIIDERGIMPELRERIEKELLGLNYLLNGLSIARIVDITCNNADFERFRSLAKEIYISEREIDYMQRTQEMKNRVVSFENSQTLHEARSRYELEKALNEINKDELLSKEEMHDFVRMMDAQRQIKDARSDFEIKRALNDLKRSELVSDEDVDQLEAQILGKKIQRDSVNELLQIAAYSRAAQARKDDELLLLQKDRDFIRNEAVREAENEDTIERIRIQREREQADASMDRLLRMRKMQLEADEAELHMKRVDEMERKDQDYRHIQDLQSASYKHTENIHEMDTRVKIHEADSREREAILLAEKEREARERDEAKSREMNDERRSMYQEVMASMKEVTLAGLASSSHRQGMPKDTDNPNPAPRPSGNDNAKYYIPFVYGPAPFALEAIRAMITAGSVKADTIIRVNGQDWPAGTLTEFSDLFSK